MDERHVGFAEAIRLGFRNYFRFSGRAQRAEYWWFVLFGFLGQLVLTVPDAIFFGLDVVADDVSPFASLFALIVFIPTLSAGWRRMHDVGRSGLWLLLPYATLIWMVAGLAVMGFEGEGVAALVVVLSGLVAFFVSLVFVIVQLATDSDPEPNRYGPSPKYDFEDEPYGDRYA